MPHSVILLSDVPGLGQVGEIHKVKVGYARNYLIPKRLAIFATADALKRFEKQKEKILVAREKQISHSKGLAEKLSKVGLVFERTLGPGGRLFGSVSPYDIVTELAKLGLSVEKRSVLMHAALKTTGDHVVRIRIHSQVVVDVPVKIIGKEMNKAHEPATESTNEETKEEVKEEAKGTQETQTVESKAEPKAEVVSGSKKDAAASKK
jgi:large subunit ribosomal protein L9